MSTHTHREEEARPREIGAPAAHMDEAVDVGLENPEAFIKVPGQKICCVCGTNLKGKERYKDALGRYWCLKCGDADHARKHQNDSVNCPDCGKSLTMAELQEIDGKKVCGECFHKRELAIKREKARIAAAEEEAREQARLRKRLTIGGITVAVLALIYFVISQLGW